METGGLTVFTLYTLLKFRPKTLSKSSRVANLSSFGNSDFSNFCMMAKALAVLKSSEIAFKNSNSNT